MLSSKETSLFFLGAILIVFGIAMVYSSDQVVQGSLFFFAGITMVVSALWVEDAHQNVFIGILFRDQKGLWWYTYNTIKGDTVKSRKGYKTKDEARIAQQTFCQTNGQSDTDLIEEEQDRPFQDEGPEPVTGN